MSPILQIFRALHLKHSFNLKIQFKFMLAGAIVLMSAGEATSSADVLILMGATSSPSN